MKSSFIAVALAAALSFGSALADGAPSMEKDESQGPIIMTVHDLKGFCNSPPGSSSRMYCQGYILGIADAMIEENEHGEGLSCFKGGLDQTTMVAIFEEAAAQEPLADEMSASTFLESAFELSALARCHS